MTKVICNRLDCEFLGDGYICQKNEIMLRTDYSSISDNKCVNCSDYKEDEHWTIFVNTLQEQVDKGDKVI